MAKRTYTLSIVLEALGPVVDHTYRPPMVHKLASILSSHRSLKQPTRTASEADILAELDEFLTIPQLAGKVHYVLVKLEGRGVLPFAVDSE